MEIRTGLRKAIDELYRVFASYNRPAWFVGCPCCWNEATTDPVAELGARIPGPGGNRPLRELTNSELVEVAGNVPHLGGDVDVLRHYLPRVYELAVSEGFGWPDFEPLVERLTYGNDRGGIPWSTWPIEEQVAIQHFLNETWVTVLREPPGDLNADTVLCGIGLTGHDVGPLLDKWLKFDEPFATQHLADFLKWNTELSNGRLANAFWGSRSEPGDGNIRKIVRWASASKTLQAVLEGFERVHTDSQIAALSECLSRLTGNDGLGETHLERGVQRNDTGQVRALLANGVDPDEVNRISGLPLLELALHEGFDDVAALFVEHGANIERLDRPDEQGRTLLQRVAAQGPNTVDIRRVLALGASVAVVDQFGWTPLHSAAAYGYLEVVRELLSAGADPSACTREGKTPTDFARSNRHDDVVALLRRHLL